MIIGTVHENKDDEYRVGITPGVAEVLTHAGHTALVEAGAGIGSSYDDDQYAAHGMKLAPLKL
jgi:alanine dehydrogenase